MCDENIEIGVTEITNNILVSAQPTDQIIDINVLEEVENVELTITPSVVEVNIDVTQELITEVVTIDANTCVNIVDVTVTDATDNVVLNITPSLVEVNINRGENNLSIEEYDTFADLPTIGDTDTYYITLDENKFWRWDAINEVYVEIASSNDKIPYLGAYKNSDLGEWGIKSNWFGLDTTPTNPPTAVGTLTWNDIDGTADLILKGGNVTLQLGQEQVLRVVNKTGATLNEADFRAVRVRSVAEGGAQGQRLAVLLAQADSDADSATTIGLVTESIADNQEGFITTSGNVNKINTTGAKSFGGAETWSDGDVLYLSPTHAGYLTNVKPQAPNHTVIIGWVVYAHANNGKIFVKVDNGYELDELHNVKINSPVNKDALIYNSSLGVWENKPLSGLLTATSPLSITSNVISISQANATTDGYVSSADWNYFSAKQQPLSGTGFVKATGSVISYDNTVYTPQSRTLTINGTSYDLSADRSWSISVGSGMRNVSSFVATSGQTTFTIVGGYTAGLVDVFVNGVRLNGGDYTATNGTTVVLSVGAIANDLVDIINYTASLTSGVTGSGTTNYIPLWSGSSNLTNSLISQSGTTITANGVFKANGVIASIDGGLYAGSGYQLVFADYGSSEFASIEGSSFSGASSYLRFITNGSERMRITSSGFVGINTSSPRALLDVVGNIYSRDIWIQDGYNLLFGNLTTGASSTYIYGVGGDGVTNYLGFATNGSEKLRITSGGNVGIGTTSPTQSLTVVMNAGTNATGIVIKAINDGGSGSQPALNYVNGSGNNIAQIVGDNGTGYLAFNMGSSNTERMRITNSGNIGINTSSPTTQLNIVNASPNSSTLDAILDISNNIDSNFRILNTGSSASDKRAAIGTSTGTSLAFHTSNTERMRITSGGNIEIPWLNNVTNIMNYDNSYRMGTLYQANARTLTFFSCGNDGNPSITFNTRLGAGSSSTDYGTEKMRITSSGFVGINTSTPTQRFTINQGATGFNQGIPASSGTTQNGIMRLAAAYGTYGEVMDFGMNVATTYGWIQCTNYGNLGVNYDLALNPNGGGVGIGTTSPSTGFGGTINNVKLAIRNGTPGQAGGTSVLLIGGDNNHYSFIEAQHTGGGNTYLSFGTSTGAVNPTEKMRIAANGKVGIGTTNPTEKFNVYTNELIWGFDIQHGYTASNQYYIAFRNSAGNQTGNIQGNGSSTSYNTTSDYRLKQDLKPFSGLDLVKNINAYDYEWKYDNSRSHGVLAHELQEVLPYAVVGIKDGNQMQGVDYSKIVPVLVQAIKELNAKLEAK